MNEPRRLLERLEAIGHGLARRETAVALIGLGSVGQERDRLDVYSDLDFFVVVRPGCKPGYLADLSWLSAAAPIAYAFPNTTDGYKLLYDDGILCEFAVFEEAELRAIPFAPGRLVWRAPGAPEAIAAPPAAAPADPPRTTEWLLGEALTNLYVGLARLHRGEKLSALRFIQGYAVDRVLELMAHIEPATAVAPDPFSPERRFEFRYPRLTDLLPAFLPGYDRSRASALAQLAFLDEHFELNEAMKAAVLRLGTIVEASDGR